MTEDDDSRIREAAFEAVRRLVEVRGELSSADLKVDFEFFGQRIPFWRACFLLSV